MDHGLDLLFFKNLFETLAVTNVLLIKLRAFTCDLLDAVNHHLLGIIEIVSDHHIVSCIQKLHNRVASDKSCSACYKNSHIFLPAPLSPRFIFQLKSPGNLLFEKSWKPAFRNIPENPFHRPMCRAADALLLSRFELSCCVY